MKKHIYINIKKIIILSLITYLSTISYIYADSIEFKNGYSIEGTVINKNEKTTTIKFEGGTIDFNTAEIGSIIPSITIEKKSDTVDSSPPTQLPLKSLSSFDKPKRLEASKSEKSSLLKNRNQDVNLDKETDYFVDYFGGRENFLKEFEKFKIKSKKKPNDFENHYKLGLSYFYLKNYEKAVSELNIVLNNNPKDLEARRFLGYAHYQTGNIPMAIEQFKKRLEGRPFDTKMRSLLASCYFQINNLKQAASEYEKIIGYDETNALVIQKLANIYNELGITQRAQELQEMAKKIDPSRNFK